MAAVAVATTADVVVTVLVFFFKKNYFFLFARTLARQTQHLKFINWSHRRIFTFYYFKGSKKLYRVQIFIYQIYLMLLKNCGCEEEEENDDEKTL